MANLSTITIIFRLKILVVIERTPSASSQWNFALERGDTLFSLTYAIRGMDRMESMSSANVWTTVHALCVTRIKYVTRREENANDDCRSHVQSQHAKINQAIKSSPCVLNGQCLGHLYVMLSWFFSVYVYLYLLVI